MPQEAYNCPVCESDNIGFHDPPEILDDEVTISFKCDFCNSKWYQTFGRSSDNTVITYNGLPKAEDYNFYQCPFCEFTGKLIRREPPDYGESKLLIWVECGQCGTSWSENYVFNDIRNFRKK